MTAHLPLLAVNLGASELIIIGLTVLPTVAVLVVIGLLLLATRRNRRTPDVPLRPGP